MDLATESRIAAILMREAADLRRKADKEGVHVYLEQPKARVRPNPRFLAATVVGVQQANRSVEMNEMWRIREKERDLDERLVDKSKDRKIADTNYRERNSKESASKRNVVADNSFNASCSSSDGGGGLRDEELEQFLHSRAKRGRGAVGSRMDEAGPYLPRSIGSKEDIRYPYLVDRRVAYGPEKPSSLKSYRSSEEDSDRCDRSSKKRKERSKDRSEKRRSQDKSKDKKKKRKEKRSKHRK